MQKHKINKIKKKNKKFNSLFAHMGSLLFCQSVKKKERL